jgi:hypothetical protein
MHIHNASNKKETRPRAWLKFGVGLVVLSALVVFFASGCTSPGAFGEVLCHNQAHDIDASPLFYTEVENMPELEQGVKELREEARCRQVP